jgi:hypothetical protein
MSNPQRRLPLVIKCPHCGRDDDFRLFTNMFQLLCGCGMYTDGNGIKAIDVAYSAGVSAGIGKAREEVRRVINA